ncbi:MULTISPECIES: iron-siderophore ABC transporter substrate-binding protein [unclassified Streptomyces]|uniref:iron-siderophore ABC transporter substrate-binding protein n=1 Tax=unclassified Streptomyces TaxID=2593676 RepID=UPI00165672BB|nr:iron-siderophore ABC transporter substrate-binding protein [Streptomyces sp. CB02980]MCB8901625.1 iron-siderophore ABC transporter substrate-binding protein [Streptomyces sp. CB02980]
MPSVFTPLRRRVLVAGAAALSLGLMVTGCGSDDKKDDAAGPAGKAPAGAFPVTIKSALGSAVIKDKPKRVVTLGQGSAETAIALGNVPVGIEEYPWGSDKSGYLPWIHDAVKKSGATLPKQFKGGEELDIEAITELEPDVILAPWSGLTQKQYDILKDIAPTVAYPEKAWSTNWDQQIEIIAKALGQPEKAKELESKIESQLADAAASRPHYKNVTFSYIYNTGPGTLGVFKPEEQRVAMVSKLGLKVDPIVNTFPETEGTDSALIGLENANKLAKSDIAFTFYMDEKSRKTVEAQPLYAAIPAVKKNALVYSHDTPFVTASSMINPLTVPYSIERYLPMIDKAVAKAGK